jgi:hypothetical protein
MIYRLVVALSLAATASAALYKEDPTHLKFLWESFKNEFGKQYNTMDEETGRFQHFVQNLKNADQRNAQELSVGGNAVHGITRFSDLSQAEFESQFLTADPSMRTNNIELDTTVGTVDTTASLVDWTGKLTTPVKDQVSLFFSPFVSPFLTIFALPRDIVVLVGLFLLLSRSNPMP